MLGRRAANERVHRPGPDRRLRSSRPSQNTLCRSTGVELTNPYVLALNESAKTPHIRADVQPGLNVGLNTMLAELTVEDRAAAIAAANRLGDIDTLPQRLGFLGPMAGADVLRLLRQVDFLQDEGRHVSANDLAGWLLRACAVPETGIERVRDLEDAARRDRPSPRWPTGIAKIDALLGGGGHGVTVLGGSPKVGKTLLATGIAVEAAVSGWDVHYANGELTEPAMAARMLRYRGGMAQRALLSSRLHCHQVGPGWHRRSLAGAITETLDEDTDRVLVVLDSINTLTDFALMSGRRDYFATLGAIGMLAMQSRRWSEGRISWLLVSELNQRGGTKGGKLDYTGDVILGIRRTPEPSTVSLGVDLSRETAAGPCGEYLRVIETGEFVSAQMPAPDEPPE